MLVFVSVSVSFLFVIVSVSVFLFVASYLSTCVTESREGESCCLHNNVELDRLATAWT